MDLKTFYVIRNIVHQLCFKHLPAGVQPRKSERGTAFLCKTYCKLGLHRVFKLSTKHRSWSFFRKKKKKKGGRKDL